MNLVSNCTHPFIEQFDIKIYSFVIIIILFIFSVYYFKYFLRDIKTDLAFGAVLIGGFINYSQRLLTGCVTDYFHFFGVVFNIQDVMITGGVAYLIYRTIINKNETT
jgi:lipoprotein signal peptidase